MNTVNAVMERHHRAIIYTLAFVVIFFAASCTFHDVLHVSRRHPDLPLRIWM
jgi:hypothetical protein